MSPERERMRPIPLPPWGLKTVTNSPSARPSGDSDDLPSPRLNCFSSWLPYGSTLGQGLTPGRANRRLARSLRLTARMPALTDDTRTCRHPDRLSPDPGVARR